MLTPKQKSKKSIFIKQNLLKIRFFIYFTAGSILFLILFFQAQKIDPSKIQEEFVSKDELTQTEDKIFLLSKEDIENQGQFYSQFYTKKDLVFKVPSTTKHENLNLKLTFNQPTELPAKIKIIHSFDFAFYKYRESITKPEKLKEKLLEKNETLYPNGSLFSRFGKKYFMEKGKLRPIEGDFRLLGFKNEDFIKLGIKDLANFKVDNENPIKTSNLISKGNFPRGVIIRMDDDYFITGSSYLHPIFSHSMITNLWPEFHYIQTTPVKQENFIEIPCEIKKLEAEKQICQSQDLNFGSLPGGVYYLIIENPNEQDIVKANLIMNKNKSLSDTISLISRIIF